MDHNVIARLCMAPASRTRSSVVRLGAPDTGHHIEARLAVEVVAGPDGHTSQRRAPLIVRPNFALAHDANA
jgi:hypothetical protein